MDYFLISLNNENLEIEAEYEVYDDLDGPLDFDIDIKKVYKQDEYGDYNLYEPTYEEELEIRQQIAEQIADDHRQGDEYGDF
jgi:hypothetical protein